MQAPLTGGFFVYKVYIGTIFFDDNTNGTGGCSKQVL